jgi:drug/metabolite transporter (DMT)-like permease
MAEAKANHERSLGELFGELSRETSQLVRKEVELATTELTAKAKKAGAATAVGAAGGALIHAGLLVLLAALVIGLAQVGVQPWLSATLVGALATIVGYLLVNKGRSQLRGTSIAPTQTIESLKETASWTRRQGA